jgi:hypothetical protein
LIGRTDIRLRETYEPGAALLLPLVRDGARLPLVCERERQALREMRGMPREAWTRATQRETMTRNIHKTRPEPAPHFSGPEIRKAMIPGNPKPPNPRIVLRHVGGDEREVEVVGEAANSLYIVWPMCGVYRLDLKKNLVFGTKKRWSARDLDFALRVYDQLVKRQTVRPGGMR